MSTRLKLTISLVLSFAIKLFKCLLTPTLEIFISHGGHVRLADIHIHCIHSSHWHAQKVHAGLSIGIDFCADAQVLCKLLLPL